MRGQRPTATPTVARAFTALAEGVKDLAVVFLDPNGTVSYWGESAARVHGWTKEEARGQPLSLLYPEGGSEDGGADEHLARARAEGEYAGEGHRLRRSGDAFWAGTILAALRDEEDSSVGFALLVRDLSARQSAEAGLSSTLGLAEPNLDEVAQASQAKTRFLTVMSHEIRTPLNGMLGYLDLLDAEVGGSLTPQQKGYVARARKGGNHVMALVEEILDITLIEAGEVRIEQRACRLSDVVESAVAMIEPDALEQELAIHNSVPEAELIYWGHEDRVRQVLANLLSNAVKFTDSGGRVTVSAEVVHQRPPHAQLTGEGPWIRVDVEDTGQGIEPERLDRIFEPFVGGEPHRRTKVRGLGLGLDISRRLARLMGGDLTVRSTHGDGSTFSLWLQVGTRAQLAGREAAGGAEPREAGEIPATSFRRAGQAILMELERVVSSFVGRLRIDPEVPTAHVQDQAVLEDHLATFVADLAQSLVAMDPNSDVEDSDLQTSRQIQGAVAARHGQQRAGLGWSEENLRREYGILREELQAALKRRTPPGAKAAQGVQEALGGFLDRSEATCLANFRAALESERHPGSGSDE